jgi:hypothetical protein
MITCKTSFCPIELKVQIIRSHTTPKSLSKLGSKENIAYFQQTILKKTLTGNAAKHTVSKGFI